jgi:hypothetical protein
MHERRDDMSRHLASIGGDSGGCHQLAIIFRMVMAT